MSLEPRVIPIDFGGGVDSKTDPKLVVAGKFLELKDAVLTTEKQAGKRNGYEALPLDIVGGGTLAGPKCIKAFKDQLTALDQGRLYSFAEDLQGWSDRGHAPSIDVSKYIVSQEQQQQSYISSAYLSGISLYVNDTLGIPCATVVDTESKTVLLNQFALSATPAGPGGAEYPQPVAVVLGTTALGVVYINASNNLVLRILTTTLGGGAVFGSEINLATNLGLGAEIPYCFFDVVTTSTGLAVSYAGAASSLGTPDRVVTVTLNTAGATVNTATITTTLPAPVAIEQDLTSGNLFVYFSDQTSLASMPLYYAVYSSTLSVVLAKTTIGTGYQTIGIISAQPSATGTQKVFFSQTQADGVTALDYLSTYRATVTTASVTSAPALYKVGVVPVSRVFRVNSVDYMFMSYLVGALSATEFPQITLFLVALESSTVVGRFLSGTASIDISVHTGRVNFISPSKVEFSYGEVFYDTGGLLYGYAGFNQLRGSSSFTLDFDSPRANICTESGGSLIVNGAVTTLYDGDRAAEFGFNLFPEIVAVSDNGGGPIADGTYVYYAVYEWYDAEGNIHQSAPSLPVTVTLAGGGSEVRVTVTNAYLTEKTGVTIAIYRTLVDGTIARKVSYELEPEANDPTVPYLQFEDLKPDSDILGAPVLYTTGNVLDNTAPPPSMVMASHNGRLWMVDAEDTSLLWYTKSVSPGFGLSPSGFLTYSIDPKFGGIEALAEMDEKLVGMKSSGIFLLVGDGANDTGVGATLSLPQFVPSDVGCSNHKSLILTPAGLMFQSPKGIYLLDRKTSVSYAGDAVDAYKTQVVTSANFLQDTNEIRFLTDDGLTLVFAYLTGQWSLFTNHEGLSATTYGGLYVYAREAGGIYRETPGVYLDNATPFAWTAKTSWLGLASVQGFQRVRRVSMLGDFVNGASALHKVQISAAYDFETTYSTPVQYTLGAISALGVFQYRERLPRQKCDVISLLIEEVTTGDPAESVSFSNMSFEAAIKKGTNKLPAGRSVG